MARHELSDEEWALIQPHLPPERSGKAGHPWTAHRRVINGILWILATGAQWRDLPERYGPRSTVNDRLLEWERDGTWGRIVEALMAQGRRTERIDFDLGALDGTVVRAHKAAAGAGKKEGETPEQSRQRQALGVSRGGLSTKVHVLCEGAGKPMAVTLTPGQAHEATQAGVFLDQVKVKGKPGRPRQRFEAIAGDKGYDSEAIRDDLRGRGSEPVIAHRKDRHGQYPERSEGFDKEKYRRRNVVERLIGRFKEFRSIATRYAKLAEGFIGLIRLAFIRIWMKDLLSDRA